MFEKLTSNQRLILAVAISFVFFIGYGYLFPQKDIKTTHNTIKQSSETKNKSLFSEAKSLVTQVTHSKSKTVHVTPSKSDTLVVVKSKRFVLKIDTLGRISSMVLLAKKYITKNGKPTQLIEKNGEKPLILRFDNAALNKQAKTIAYESSVHEIDLQKEAQTVTLIQKLPSLTVTKKITFYSNGHYSVHVALSKDAKYSIGLGQRPIAADSKMMTVEGAMIYYGDGKNKIFEDGDVKVKHIFHNVHFVSAFDQYFADIFYNINKDSIVTVEPGLKNNPLVYISGSQHMTLQGYLGSKNYETLKSLNPLLVNTIEYGWFTFAARPLFIVLAWLYSIFGNWGWAIVALTILVRLVLYPLTYKGMVSMQKMKLVAPKVKALQAKYKGDAQRVNAAVMQEYKKHGVNPLGGCLPMVLQIPIFYAMYRLIFNTPELQGAPWILWVHNLGQMDHYYILPILMGATMFFQQHITPNNFTDPLQAKVFKYIPVIFTFFFITFPAGLVLYWLTNNLASIAQQYIVNRKFATLKQPDDEQPVEKLK